MSENWYTDWQQNKRLRELRDDMEYVSASLASARSSQSRLRAELSKVQGSLEQRLNRLSAAFDAFVEISDLRMTLGLFDAQGRVRHQARLLVAGTPDPAEVSDVDGYWLAPALVALRIAADGVVATDSLELAKARDPHRTAVLQVLGTAVLGGRETVPAGLLADALPALPPDLPRYQRAVWTLAADGFFGEAGWELARRRGVEFLRGLGAEERAAAVAEVVPRVPAVVPKDLAGGDLEATLLACARLTALREWVTSGVAGYTGEPALEIDPGVRESLGLLIDEGSPVELPLLARERELRAVIETQSQPSTWDGSVGRTLELLRADLVDDEYPNRRALAVRVCAEPLLSVAEKLAETAGRPAPERMTLRSRFGSVTVTATGPEPDSLATAERHAERSEIVPATHRRAAYGAAGVAVMFAVLAMVAGWGWSVLAVAAAAVGAYQWVADLKARKTAAENVVAIKKTLRSDVDRKATQFAEARADLLSRQATIDEDLAALRISCGRAATADDPRAGAVDHAHLQ